LIGEINTIVRPGEGVITTNTICSGNQVITKTISTRDNAGNVKTETVYVDESAAMSFQFRVNKVETTLPFRAGGQPLAAYCH
jgi:hypothetical protein